MEIERRFLVSGFPEEGCIRRAKVAQGYLCTDNIEARIRKTVNRDCTTYKLCFKSDGTLSRKEVEFEISEVHYEELLDLLQEKMIEKDYRVYQLGDRRLKVCEVDPGTKGHYYYAEIEFNSEEEALVYDCIQIPNLLEEVTYDKSYNMKNYWHITRILKQPFKS
ncbi:CYTH domain-containing protein [Cellulosilyticum ruminicola]|uniref:hypothetical protein n=1 Tax=Cellulosilyticum ruminicola TaxID=425254 RepID=UPI0006D12D6A|nr:hypothetical protein [Cellulosilyticum ruminicola]